ncbi:hypothetical protein N0V88_004478 [Collariella sp. IMI 366227]|nr:hypothetical protein N0V88_004478 [Collariella sp. IMI 366227]
MPRFSVAFGRRKSSADNIDHAAATGPSFRVLERTEVVGAKPFDGGARFAHMNHSNHKSSPSDATAEDNIFADLKSNRGSTNTTKTVLTDNSSRHSNASTAPSSAGTGGSDEYRGGQHKKTSMDIHPPPIPRSSGGFLKAAGRTFSFGGQKRHMQAAPTIDESPPQTPANGRPRAPTTSTTTTLTPPRVDSDFNFDLGGDFSKMLLGNDKRASVATLRNDQYTSQTAAPRSLTNARPVQPTPLQIDMTTKVEPAQPSWSSQHSNDQLIASPAISPSIKEVVSPPVPRHTSPILERQRSPASPTVSLRRPPLVAQKSSNEQEEGPDEEARLLKDSLSTVTRFMNGAGATNAGSSSASRYRRNEDDDSLFDASHTYSLRYASRYTVRKPASPPASNKVMTPAEFERYRKDKERQDRERTTVMAGRTDGDDDEEDHYEDDEDDIEKAKQQAKQRRKQEAHMAVYRQQMMKVTGEHNGSVPSSRPSLQMSFSTPNLPNAAPTPAPGANTSENSDEDEEVPLAILAAHGFPNRNRPPTRLTTMGSNPNLRATQQLSFQRPVSAVGDPQAPANPRLPAFARNLPKDPFLGAGLVRNPVRESFAMGGGAPAPGPGNAPVPPGGLIGVIANEERNRALRRGSPHLEGPSSLPATPGFDPINGIPAHMMYPPPQPQPMLSPGDHAQIQMNQQMQQFMQMQMQRQPRRHARHTAPHLPSVGHLPMSGGGGGLAPGGPTPNQMRHSFLGGGNDSMLDLPYGRGDAAMRTMSMVQPSSASWIQPAPAPGAFGAPSIRIQGGGGGGYALHRALGAQQHRPSRQVPPRVARAPPAAEVGHLRKSSTMSGALGGQG